MDMSSVKDDIALAVEPIKEDLNKMLGRNLMQPFRPANSGSRAYMSGMYEEQFINLTEPEIPIIQTPYDTAYGQESTSYRTSDYNYDILARVEKFDFKPGHHYWLLTYNRELGQFDVIERVSYKHKTEDYGYLWNNEHLDILKPGSTIRKGSIIKTSTSFDSIGNKMNGTNLLSAYISTGRNLEDSIILSETGAKKLGSCLVKFNDIAINDNDIMKDRYGDGVNYKAFPDIGEEVKNGIFCSIHRVENNNILFTLDRARLRDFMISDRNILMNGRVADIDVYCNNPEALGDSYYNQQLGFYYQQKLRFAREFVQTVESIAGPMAPMTYNLKKLYSTCRDIINGKPFYKGGQFSNIIMEVVVVEELPMRICDKLVDRYGGKGVVSEIVPDEMMPLLDNGKRVECIKNQSTCINRENLGQLHELSLSFIGMRLLDYFRTGVLTNCEMVAMYHEFLSFIDPVFANYMVNGLDMEDESDCMSFIAMLLDEDKIIITDQPYTTNVTVDTIREIYKAFPFVQQCSVVVPIEDSNGDIDYIPTNRKLVAAPMYHIRLKQYAESKFSVTSLAATNLKNLNTRSKANKMYEAKYSKTPIMFFGNMECIDGAHIGIQHIVMNLMMYSSSPQARRLFEELLVGDPYNVNIRLDHDSKNRNAEIINAVLKTIGLKLSFIKQRKIMKNMCGYVMCKTVPNTKHKPKTNAREIFGNFDELDSKYKIAMQRNPHEKPICKMVMCKEVNPNVKQEDTGKCNIAVKGK